MDKFKQKLITKNLRLSPNKVTPEALINYFTFQKFNEEAIDEIYIIINNPMSDISPCIKSSLNDVIVKSLRKVPRK